MSIADKLSIIAENEQKVYDAGETAGIKQGKQTQKSNFEKAYSSWNSQTACDYFFAGKGWNNDSFYVSCNLKPTRAQGMFAMSGISGDLADMCEKRGINIDFSNCKLFANFSSNANSITRFGILDISKATDNISFAYNRALVTIDKLIVSASTKYSPYAFEECTKLVNLIVEGVIAKANFNVQWCTKLSKASIESIINCLSSTTSGLSVTLSLTAVKKAFETSSGANDGNTSEEWLNLIATKQNWTISLK